MKTTIKWLGLLMVVAFLTPFLVARAVWDWCWEGLELAVISWKEMDKL